MLSDTTVNKAIKGERDALQILCEDIAKNVLFRATFICGNQTDAEDISQEALIRVCKNIQKLRSPGHFHAWLSRIVLNEARRFFEKNSKYGSALSIDDYRDNITEERHNVLPYENAAIEENKEVVMEIISILPVRQREAVLLHYYDGMNVTEVAGVMGTSKANISQNLALARKKIKKELEKKENRHILSGTALSFTTLPLESLITSTLKNEAASFIPENPVWLGEVLTAISEYLAICAASVITVTTTSSAVGATTAAPSKVLTVVIACTVAAVATFAIIVVNMLVNDSTLTNQTAINIAGSIEFSGGYDFGENTVYVNPSDAIPLAIDHSGIEAKTLEWRITESDSDEPLYMGLRDGPGTTLHLMREDSQAGLYILEFRIETESGDTFRMGRNFYILPDDDNQDFTGKSDGT